jgi:hypothetical protein
VGVEGASFGVSVLHENNKNTVNRKNMKY